MSTSDAFLNIGAAALVHDMPKALRGHSVKNELLWARIATVLLAIAAAVFALYSYYQNDRLVALLGAFGWGTFAAAIVPVVVIGLNWKRANAMGAITAIGISLIINFSFEIFSVRLPHGISGPFVAFVTSMTLFIVVSLLTPDQTLDPDIDKVMEI